MTLKSCLMRLAPSGNSASQVYMICYLIYKLIFNIGYCNKYTILNTIMVDFNRSVIISLFSLRWFQIIKLTLVIASSLSTSSGSFTWYYFDWYLTILNDTKQYTSRQTSMQMADDNSTISVKVILATTWWTLFQFRYIKHITYSPQGCPW